MKELVDSLANMSFDLINTFSHEELAKQLQRHRDLQKCHHYAKKAFEHNLGSSY